MDSLPTLVPGEAGWDKTWNDSVAKIVTAITSATADSGWITSGITLVNGFTKFGDTDYDTVRYRYVSLGGAKKAVIITGGLKVPADFPTDNWVQFATLPDDLNQFIVQNTAVTQGFTGFVNNGSIAAVSFSPAKNAISVRSKVEIAEGSRLQLSYIGIA